MWPKLELVSGETSIQLRPAEPRAQTLPFIQEISKQADFHLRCINCICRRREEK